MDLATRTATGPRVEEVLTFAEFELLTLLLEHANATLARTAILQAVFARSVGIYDRSADVLMGRLRKKLAQAGVNLTVESVRAWATCWLDG